MKSSKKISGEYREIMIRDLRSASIQNDEARYYHRIHALLLIAQGMDFTEVAQLCNISSRTIYNWFDRYQQQGTTGLRDEKRPGRTKRLKGSQLGEVAILLRDSPKKHGFSCDFWTGDCLSELIQLQFRVYLSTRQCQRLLQQLRAK